MPRNVYFSQGTASEQNLYEDITIEGLRIYGHEAYYIPRKIVNEDAIFNEDQLSEFGSAYEVEAYVANVDGYEGEGDLLTKFGLEIKDQITLVIANRRWEQLIGRHIGVDSQLDRKVSRRPMEGDLIYLPFVKGLFEISFVEQEDPFYQLQNLPTFQLKCELFQYSGEEIDTGVDDIDAYETKFNGAEQNLTTVSTLGVIPDLKDFDRTGDELYPAIGEEASATIDGITITAEVKEILELYPYELFSHQEYYFTTEDNETIRFTWNTNELTTGFEETEVTIPAMCYSHLGLSGGLKRILISKDNHTPEALAAGAVAGRWAQYRILDLSQSPTGFEMIDADLGTGDRPTGEFVMSDRPTKLAMHGIKRSDGSNDGFPSTNSSGAITTSNTFNLTFKESEPDGTDRQLIVTGVEELTLTESFAETKKSDVSSDNEDFETIGNNFIDFSISNPFGLPNA